MSWQTELNSWMFPTTHTRSDPPSVGHNTPQTQELHVPVDGKPTVVTFLRHCGCPFAEKTFLSMREAASQHPDIQFMAVSHSDEAATGRWLRELGGADRVNVTVDDQRKSYAAWGLGVSSFWHVLNPWSLYDVYKLGKQKGIWNRPTESGTRWQTSGSFAVDAAGIVKKAVPSQSAGEVPDFKELVNALSE